MSHKSTQKNVEYKGINNVHNFMYKASAILMILFVGTLIYTVIFGLSANQNTNEEQGISHPLQFVSFYQSDVSNFTLK